jgi:hypothetical protein
VKPFDDIFMSVNKISTMDGCEIRIAALMRQAAILSKPDFGQNEIFTEKNSWGSFPIVSLRIADLRERRRQIWLKKLGVA